MEIETFVFFDLETTGLPHLEKNRTKITELCFIAVSRHDILSCNSCIPLMNKLSYVFNPERKIQTIASQKTGLTNMKLKNQQIFKSIIPTLNHFLEGFPKPVCLVAHNGNSFDFKVLRAEYNDVEMYLPCELLCVDSIIGFRKIFKENDIRFSNFLTCDHVTSTTEEEIITDDDDDDDWPKLNASVEDWQEIEGLMKEENSPSPKKNSKQCFQLSTLYKRLLNKNALDAHRAEADCLMLLQCVVALNAYFLPWADSSCKLISSIKPLERH